jgi:hypothetical protein
LPVALHALELAPEVVQGRNGFQFVAAVGRYRLVARKAKGSRCGGTLMNTVPYSKLHPEELADMERRFGRELEDREALWLMRQERENAMRENEFYSRTTSTYLHGSPIDEVRPEEFFCVAAEEIVAASEERWPWYVPASIFAALFMFEAWLAARYWHVIQSWFR